MAYWIEESHEYVFIHYVGNDTVAVDFVHGNNRDKKSRPHVMTNRSVRDKIREQGYHNEMPSNIYKNMTVDNISNNENIQNILVNAPRNNKQCSNLKFLAKNKSLLTQDQWWNALCQAYEYQDGDFVKSFNIFPNLESTVVHPGLQNDLNFIFKYLYEVKNSEHPPTKSSFSMFYDDTYEIGPFLVTPITFINIMMEDPKNDNKAPTQPAGFFIHELRCTDAYVHNLGIMAECFPHLKTEKVPFIIDGDDALKKAIEKTTAGFVVRCHNHIGTNIKDQCYKQKLRMSASEMDFYKNQILQIFHKDTLHDALLYATELFSKTNEDGSPLIPSFLSEYVQKNLLPADKIKHIGKWEIEQYGLYVPEVGAVNSREEGFNAVLKRFQKHEFQELDGVLATLDKISHYYWLENQKSKAGIGKYNLADWAKPFFENIDPHALKIGDIKNPDDFVSELLNSRNKVKPSGSKEKEVPVPDQHVVVDSLPKDSIFIAVTEDILAELTEDSLPEDTPELAEDFLPEDMADSIACLIDIEAASNFSDENDLNTPLHDDLIDLIDANFGDIPVIVAAETTKETELNTVNESINLMNFDEAEPSVTDKANESFDLLDLDEMVEEMNRSFEAEVEPDDCNKSSLIDNGTEEMDLDEEESVANPRKRKSEIAEVENPNKKRRSYPSSELPDIQDDICDDDIIHRLQQFELDLVQCIEKEDDPKIWTMLNDLFRMNVNLDIILTNNIGKTLTHLKAYKSRNISKMAGRLSRRWKSLLFSSTSTEYETSVARALRKKWVTGSRAKLLLEYITQESPSSEIPQEVPSPEIPSEELDEANKEQEFEVNHADHGPKESFQNDGTPSSEIPSEDLDEADKEQEFEVNHTDHVPIESSKKDGTADMMEDEEDMTNEVTSKPVEKETEINEEAVNNSEETEKENLEVHEIYDEEEDESSTTNSNDNHMGMKDLPDHLVTKCGRAKICVDEGRITRVQNKQTGTVSYTIEEGNKVYLVKTNITKNKVDFDCSCTVTGVCISFHVDAVKYFTTGSMSGSTIRPNMRKLGWMKKKGKSKELAGKKPTKFNTTKFIALQNDLREHQATLVDFEKEKDLEDDNNKDQELVQEDPEANSLSCNLCHKSFASEKGMKIHMKKLHASKDTGVTASSIICDFCSKTFGSEKGLKIHKSKAH